MKNEIITPNMFKQGLVLFRVLDARYSGTQGVFGNIKYAASSYEKALVCVHDEKLIVRKIKFKIHSMIGADTKINLFQPQIVNQDYRSQEVDQTEYLGLFDGHPTSIIKTFDVTKTFVDVFTGCSILTKDAATFHNIDGIWVIRTFIDNIGRKSVGKYKIKVNA